MGEKSNSLFKKFLENIWIQRFIMILFSIIAILVIGFEEHLRSTLSVTSQILLLVLVSVSIVYLFLSQVLPTIKEKKINSDATTPVYSYSRESSPLEKKYQEIDRQLDEWQKDFKSYINLREDPNAEDYADSPKAISTINGFEEARDSVYRLAETYKEHEKLIEFAHKIATYLDDHTKADYYKNLLIQIDQKELAKLQDKDYIQAEQKKSLSTEYYNKSQALKEENRNYIKGFIGISVVFLVLLACLYIFYQLPSENDLISFLIVKTTLSITIAMVVFWLARFCNRRVHENVHLIEEYAHRSLLLNTFDLLTNSVNDENHKKEILDKILTSLIQTPTECLNRKKADKIPNDFIKLLGSLSSIKPEIIIKNDDVRGNN